MHCHVENQRGNNSTIRSLTDQRDCSVNELKEMGKVYHEHFYQLFEMGILPRRFDVSLESEGGML